MANAGIRYGARIRKLADSVMRQKRERYVCGACGRRSVRRAGTSIWNCRHCNATFAGGAYAASTPAGEAARRIVESLGSGGAVRRSGNP